MLLLIVLRRDVGEGQLYVGKNSKTAFGIKVCKPLLIYSIILETLTGKCSATTKSNRLDSLIQTNRLIQQNIITDM